MTLDLRLLPEPAAFLRFSRDNELVSGVNLFKLICPAFLGSLNGDAVPWCFHFGLVPPWRSWNCGGFDVPTGCISGLAAAFRVALLPSGKTSHQFFVRLNAGFDGIQNEAADGPALTISSPSNGGSFLLCAAQKKRSSLDRQRLRPPQTNDIT